MIVNFCIGKGGTFEQGICIGSKLLDCPVSVTERTLESLMRKRLGISEMKLCVG